MSQDRVVKSRRRGDVLQNAILEAAWEELREHAWSGFRIDRVAVRAGTGKAGIYRRWSNRAALVRAAALHKAAETGTSGVTSGELRRDLIDFLDGAARFVDGPFGEAVRGLMTEPGPASDMSLPSSGLAAQPPGIVSSVVDRARRDGVLGSGEPTPLVLNLGAALVNYEYLWTGRAPTTDTITEIVDTVWLPALRAACGDT